MNYGDWYGERTYNWGNLEYDLPWTMLIDFLRKGNIEKLYRADQAAGQVSDINVIHQGTPAEKTQFVWTNTPQKGQMWKHSPGHTGGYDDPTFSQISSTNNFIKGIGDYGHTWTRGLFSVGLLRGNNHYIEDGISVADRTIGLAE